LMIIKKINNNEKKINLFKYPIRNVFFELS